MTQAAHAETAPTEKIRWLGWGPAVFQRARKEDKLIVLDSGATWCHWCHVMDRVTYEDAEVVRLLNEKFLPVRIDRDRLPQVDAHYQRSVPLIRGRGGGGWPLTVVITPEGHVLYKATFLPPRASAEYGTSSGLIDLLKALDDAWRDNREKIVAAGKDVRDQMGLQQAAFERPGEPSDAQIAAIAAGIKDAYDPKHGGFGSAPKFFAAPAIELLLIRGSSGDRQAGEMATQTLEKIARGGVYDHVGGGFHRYSVDARWHVPHFEKMAYDNAALLRLYADAHALTGRDDFRRVAAETRAWVDRVLRDGGRGSAFFASQDADVGLHDDGDYFTWTAAEVKAALGDDAGAALTYFALDDRGDVHGRPGRNVLHTPKTLAQAAKLLGKQDEDVSAAMERAKRRLLEVRRRRPAPSVDRTVFADLNGMLIDAYLATWERLGDESARETAIATLNHLLATLRDAAGVFAHYRHDGDGPGQPGGLRQVGLLADQAWMARALLHAYTATADRKYVEAAATLADYILRTLTTRGGGFLGGPAPASPQPWEPAAMQAWEDSPTRSAASVAAHVLLDLAYLAGDQRYAAAARKALAGLAGGADRRWGTFLAGYAAALDRLVHGPRTVVIAGPAEDKALRALAAAARKTYVPNGIVLVLDPSVEHQAAVLGRLGYKAADKPVAYVCRGKTCLPPAHTPDELRQRVAELAKTLP